MQGAVDAALGYAQLGWHIFPCRPNKKPFTNHGYKDATTDPAQIRAWWKRWPNAQIGVACGASGIVVVDLDFDTTKGIDARTTWDALYGDRFHGAALIARTPRGGEHRFYRAVDERLGIASDCILAGELRRGIDLRGDGGYAVLPSPASLGREWSEGEPMPATELDAMPQWMHEAFLQRHRSRHGEDSTAAGTVITGDGGGGNYNVSDSALAELRAALAVIDNDPRDTWLHVGMGLKSTGDARAYDWWVEWSRSSPKFDPRDQAYQWASLLEYRPDGSEITVATIYYLADQADPTWRARLASSVSVTDPATEDDVPSDDESPDDPPETALEFPLELIEGDDLLSLAVQWTIATAPRPQPALALGAWIAVLGAVIGRRVQTVTRLRSNFYACGVGPTGCGKDHAQRAIGDVFHLAGLDSRLRGGWASGTAVVTSLVNAASHCAIVDELGDRLRAWSSAVRAPWQAEIRRYLLELFSAAGSTFRANTYADDKVTPTRVLVEPNLCLYGVSGPDVLFDAVGSGAIADGFLNRILFFFAPDKRPRSRMPQRQSDLQEDIVDRLRRLDVESRPDTEFGRGLQPGADVPPDCATGCRTLPYADGGRWAQKLSDAADDRLDRLDAEKDAASDLWARFAEHAQKLALLKALSIDPRAAEIGEDATAWAERLATWCHERMHRAVVSRVAANETEAATKRVLRIIAEAGRPGITANQLTRKSQWLDRRQRKETLLTLIESGQIDSREVPTTRRPTTRYFASGGGR